MKTISGFLCGCSGIRRDALDAVPSARPLAINQGALLLLVATFAAVSSGRAWHQMTPLHLLSWLEAVAVGVLWGTLIFFIDRSVAMSLDKRTTWGLARGLAIRMPIAAVIAMTISTPLVLAASSPVLKRELRITERKAVAAEVAENTTAARLEVRRTEIESLSHQLEQLAEALRHEPDTVTFREAKANRMQAERFYQTALAVNGRRIDAAQSDLKLLSGAVITPDEQRRINALRSAIDGWQREITNRQRARDAARRVQADIETRWNAEARARHDDVAATQAQSRLDEARAKETMDARNAESVHAWSALTQPSLLNEYSAMQQIVSNPAHPDAAALWRWQWSLHLLFFFVETAVLLVKALWPAGPLDTAVLALNTADQERVTLSANAEMASMQAVCAARSALEQQALTSWTRHQARGFRAHGQDIPALWAQIRRHCQRMTRVA